MWRKTLKNVHKKVLICTTLCLMALSFTSCKNSSEDVESQDVEVSIIPDNTYLPEPSENVDAELADVTLYLPDENAEYLVPVVEKCHRTPEGIIQALVEKGALPEGTEINYFILKDNGQYISLDDEGAEISDKLTAEIDLSDYFMDGIQHTGTAGEAMMMGAIVNTMIENFHLQSIMVSANDEVIETGHCIYDEPQTFYEEFVEK